MNTPVLETERLILRRFIEDDMEALYQIYSDEEVNRFLPWFPLKSMSEAYTLFEDRYVAEYKKPQGYAYAICLKKDNYPKNRYGRASRLWLWTAQGIMASGNCNRSRTGCRQPGKKRWIAVYYCNPRQGQSAKRRCNAEYRNEIPVFL